MYKKANTTLIIVIISICVFVTALTLVIMWKSGYFENKDPEIEEFTYLSMKSVNNRNYSESFDVNYSIGYPVEGYKFQEISRGNLEKDKYTEIKWNLNPKLVFIYGKDVYTTKQVIGSWVPIKVSECDKEWIKESDNYICPVNNATSKCDYTKKEKKKYSCYYTHGTIMNMETFPYTKEINLINYTNLQNGDNILQVQLENKGIFTHPSLCLDWSFGIIKAYIDTQNDVCSSGWNKTVYDYDVNKTVILPGLQYHCESKGYFTDCLDVKDNNMSCILKGEIPKRLEKNVYSCKMMDSFDYSNITININYKAQDLQNGDFIKVILFDRDQSFSNGGSYADLIYEDSNFKNVGADDFSFTIPY